MASNRLRSRRARLQRAIAIVVLAALTLNACNHWVPPQKFSEIRTQDQNFPNHVRITISDGTVRELQHSRISGDSLIGVLFGSAGLENAFALSDIRTIEVNEFSPARTAALAIFGLLVFVGHVGF